MAKPTPNPSQIAAIESTVLEQQTMQNALNDSAALQDPVIAKASLVDAAFKDLFDWYNTHIINKYDVEVRALNGNFQLNPITETDILNVGTTPPSGRLIPTPPATDITRVPEFDGGNLSVDPLNEQQHITDQAGLESSIIIGYGPAGINPATAVTGTALTPASTTLTITDPTNPISLGVNGTFLVTALGDLAVVKITSVITPPGGSPPYTGIYGIQLLVPPTSTILSGAATALFMGFNNTERSTKTASSPALQPLMDYYVSSFQSLLNSRTARLNQQLAGIALNEDPDGTAAFATAVTNINTSKSFITSYLLTTDISNTGLASLSTERATRVGQISARLAQITAAYTGQTENYYNARYTNANNRGSTSRGTLRALSNAQSVKSNSLAMAAGLGTSISALNGILPP